MFNFLKKTKPENQPAAKAAPKMPIERLATIISVLQKVAMGDFSQNVEIPEKEDELTELIIALNLTIDDLKESTSGLEKKVEEKTKELQTILDSVPAWIFYKDKENRFIKVNKVFCEVMGKTKEELEGKSLFDLYPKEQADAFWRDDLEVIKSGKPKINIIEPVKSPKGEIWVQTDKIPYKNENNNIIGIIGFAIDITEKKLAEEEFKKQFEEIEEANKLMVGRELEMIKLKERIKELENKIKLVN